MRWVVVVIFLIGMVSFLNFYEARTRERRLAFGVVTVLAFVLIALLGSTLV
jgi:hypothetical protein